VIKIKYYDNEKKIFKDEYVLKLSDFETGVVFQKLKSHYKFQQFLKFRNGGGGRCRTWEIIIPHGTSLGLLAHEIAHAVQIKKGKQPNQKWHTKKHTSIMKRILKIANNKKDEWISNAEIQVDKKHGVIMRQEQKQREFEQYKKTPQFKLENISKSIKRWESKKKRAENVLRKLNRRKKIWEKKVRPN